MSKSKTVILRTQFDGRNREVSDATALRCLDPTLTQQQFKDDSDPNFIIEQFARTGDPALLAASNPRYGDFLGVPTSYHDALNLVLAAQDAFDALPARARARFDNDPEKFVEFVGNPDNRDEAIELGLLKEGVLPFKSGVEGVTPSSPIPTGREGVTPSTALPASPSKQA